MCRPDCRVSRGKTLHTPINLANQHQMMVIDFSAARHLRADVEALVSPSCKLPQVQSMDECHDAVTAGITRLRQLVTLPATPAFSMEA